MHANDTVLQGMSGFHFWGGGGVKRAPKNWGGGPGKGLN